MTRGQKAWHRVACDKQFAFFPAKPHFVLSGMAGEVGR